VVIEFKRDVYQRALQELSRFVTWPARGGGNGGGPHGERRHSARYLRQPHARSQSGSAGAGAKPGTPGLAASAPTAPAAAPESLVLVPNK